MRFLAVLILIMSLYLPFTGEFVFAQQEPSAAERAKLEKELAELERQIAENESTIAEYQKQGKTLTKEIASLNAQINKSNLQIKAITLTLSKLDGEIAVTQKDIQKTQSKLDANREALTRLVRRLYENDRAGLVAILLKSNKLSDFFGDVNNLMTAQDAISESVSQITDLKDQLVQKKDNLSDKRSDAVALKRAQDAQKAAADRAKQQKNQVLAETKGQEAKFQAILKETKKSAAEIRKRIFQFFGGGEMSFDQAYQLAKMAEQATGVRASFTLAILDKESALGQNVGRCGYETAMHPTRDIPIFLALVASLKEAGTAPPEPILVSCANRDGAYGGAMGPAQFIPSTWKLYAARIAEITGHNPASPWHNGDAIMGTALYLKDASRGCDSIYSKQADIERCAAAKYYAGGRWRSHLWGYGDRVATKARQFQADIDVLNS